jgi:hypothetical protein
MSTPPPNGADPFNHARFVGLATPRKSPALHKTSRLDSMRPLPLPGAEAPTPPLTR